MQLEYLMFLFDYNYWARDRMLTAVGQLTPGQMMAPADLSYGSILGALTHILNAEILWRTRCIHHRAELAAHLATLGRLIGNFDFVIYARQR